MLRKVHILDIQDCSAKTVLASSIYCSLLLHRLTMLLRRDYEYKFSLPYVEPIAIVLPLRCISSICRLALIPFWSLQLQVRSAQQSAPLGCKSNNIVIESFLPRLLKASLKASATRYSLCAWGCIHLEQGLQ